MIVKFNPERHGDDGARPQDRKRSTISSSSRARREGHRVAYPAGSVGTFNRPTDVAWDTQDNIFVADGYNNSRVAKLGKDGTWVKAVGTRGAGANQFNTLHGITVGRAQGNDLRRRPRQPPHPGVRHRPELQKTIAGIGAPWTAARRRPTQYLFSGDGNGKIYKLDHERQAARLGADEPGPRPDRLPRSTNCTASRTTSSTRASCTLWDVEKITIK